MMPIMLPLTREEVAECREALGRLRHQGFIRRDETGRWRTAGPRPHRIIPGLSGLPAGALAKAGGGL
jgi:hypothetical protein